MPLHVNLAPLAVCRTFLICICEFGPVPHLDRVPHAYHSLHSKKFYLLPTL